jgi:signal transduction histidine kinase
LRLTSRNATRTIPLVAITVAAALFLLISYQYSIFTSQKIESDAVLNVEATAQIQAHDTSGVLVNELQAVANSLSLIAASTPVMDHNTTAAAPLFNEAEKSNSQLTSDYFWVAANGSLIALSNGTSLSVVPNAGENLSARPYFAGPEESGTVYYSSATPSLSNGNVSHVFVSVPLFTNETVGSKAVRAFEGVVGASIVLSSLGKFLQTEISAGVASSVGLVDPQGVILYSSNLTSIGQNIFGPGIQSELPAGLKAPLDHILNESLTGIAGVAEISYQGSNTTIAYQPVFIGGANQTSIQQFGVIYIIAPDILAGSDATLVAQDRTLGLFLILGIAGLSVAGGVIIIGWNKRLDDTVKIRTADLLAANERLSAYAKAQTDFVNIAAHELRTPTQSIVGYAEILEGAAPLLATVGSSTSGASPSTSGKIEVSDVRMAVDSILRNAKRLKKLTDDILSASRIETNTLALSRETFDLNALVNSAIAELRNLSTTKSSPDQEAPEIMLDSETPELLVNADSTKINEVISNLLSNAIKFSSPGAKIIVSTAKRNGEAVVSVKDNGTGISSEIQPNLFSKFATNSSSGTGLGLFISKKVVEAHGGRMWARNNDGEKGSTFTFTLPIRLGDGDQKPSVS